jgi:hypothetical protein
MQYIGSELSNKALFVYKLSNSDFYDQFREEEMIKNHTDPSRSTPNNVFSVEQRCHLMDFELTKHRGAFMQSI